MDLSSCPFSQEPLVYFLLFPVGVSFHLRGSRVGSHYGPPLAKCPRPPVVTVLRFSRVFRSFPGPHTPLSRDSLTTTVFGPTSSVPYSSVLGPVQGTLRISSRSRPPPILPFPPKQVPPFGPPVSSGPDVLSVYGVGLRRFVPPSVVYVLRPPSVDPSPSTPVVLNPTRSTTE